MERRLFIFRPGQTLFILSLLVALLFGCGGGGGGGGSDGTNPPPNNPPPGGGNPGTPNTDPPSVISAAPQGNSVSVSAFIEITFDKSMDVATFQGGLEGLGNIGYAAVCVDADCKIIRLSRTTNLEYDFSYTLTLLPQVRDQEGNLLSSPYVWSFETEVFVPPLSFSSITVDGDGINTGECTAIALDITGRTHIVYYSEEDGLPKHAFCSTDCSNPANWKKELIDLEINQLEDQKLGRDINLAIDGETLHVSYRDVDTSDASILGGTDNDNRGILKYAKGVKNADGSAWVWSRVIVDDTLYGVTDTYIKVRNNTVHISYRKIGDTSSQDIIAYATCSGSCDSLGAVWNKINGEQGNDAGAPNHIFVTDTAIHISYYLDGTMKYATCLMSNDCSDQGLVPINWKSIVVDNGGADQADVGTENSLAVDDGDVIHVTYRDNSNGLLMYARCESSCADTGDAWEKIAIDAAGGSSQIKVVGNVLHVSYRNDDNKNLKYAVCPSNCLVPESWSTYTIDAPGEVGLDTYLAVDNGTVHISYRAAGDAEDLKYARGIP
ncbi:MAG: Ig-like domain-containing protein [Candidatus Manganitrophus sp. SB1]|nr:Ig-like domain-containing protein [Candidatus Manganitrophus morganii]